MRQEAFLHQARVGHSAFIPEIVRCANTICFGRERVGALQLRVELLGKECIEKRIVIASEAKKPIKEERGEQKKKNKMPWLRVVADRQAIWQAIQGEKAELQQLKVW